MIEAFVQAKQAWYEPAATTSIYAQDADGAYFMYRIACSAEDYAKLVPGTKIKVTGHKAAWAGEVEIIDDIDMVSHIARKLSYKFTQDESYIQNEIDRFAKATILLKLKPEHICGKMVQEA